MSDDRSLETMKSYTHLDIMVEGQISLSPSSTILELGEGDMADLVCSVKEGYPRADISWLVDRELWGVLDTGSQVGVEIMISLWYLSWYFTGVYRTQSRNPPCVCQSEGVLPGLCQG